MSTDYSSPLPATTITPAPVPSADDIDILNQLGRRVRQGDWNAVVCLIAALRAGSIPDSQQGRGEYLRRLQEVLVAARVARAGLNVSLGRLRAAARFTHSRALHERQRFADSTES